MTDVKTLVGEAQRFQRSARTSLDERLRWFSTLELENAAVEGDTIAFVWRDPVDGTRHGWRWEIVPDRLYLLEAHLDEDVATTRETAGPDENGIRWWGVHLYV